MITFTNTILFLFSTKYFETLFAVLLVFGSIFIFYKIFKRGD